ncbi:MAG: hypothetical protein NT016_03020 [Candidatus Aenigmarchaeota archaeon]|nr:hypothetical protein [Candidatus Aenigmarchaeota archaeon]
MRGDIISGGALEFKYARTDSYVPMYGVAGQQSYTYVSSTEAGSLDWTTGSNYAALGASEYGFQSNNQMTAIGDHYIKHYLSTNVNNGAEIIVDALGSTQVTDMCDGTWGTSFSFGEGCGCYTNAVIDTVGSGSFSLFADADNHIVTDTGITVTGGNYQVLSNFIGGFHFNDFALTGN